MHSPRSTRIGSSPTSTTAGEPAEPEWRVKPARTNVLLGVEAEGPARASFFGDLHPDFAGNVVAAMASAKLGYPVIDRVLRQRPPSDRKLNRGTLSIARMGP